MTNISWWGGLCANKLLHKVALRVLSLPATSAATERSFSKHGYIHSKLRNKLATERAAKIVYVAHNYTNLKHCRTSALQELEHNATTSNPSTSSSTTISLVGQSLSQAVSNISDLSISDEPESDTETDTDEDTEMVYDDESSVEEVFNEDSE